MQVQTKEQFLSTEGLDHEQKKFEISNSKRMFEILSSNIYKDKPLAVIREYACNAYDAHIAAGKEDVPFEVHLPNNFEPWFSIKDFGTGLSHEDVMKLYTTYGMSTKNNENKSIGMLGLGSKSAFAYTDQFTITSIFGGYQRVYQAYKDTEGVPTITMLTEEETEDSSGLEIYIPARSQDFSTFADRAERIFFRFPTLPIITGNVIDLTEVRYSIVGPNYKVRENEVDYYGHSGCWAIQGTVAYPISSSSFSTDKLSYLQRQVIDTLPLDIIFPIGKLDVAASREELNYDEFTQNNLIEAIEEVIAHLPTQFTTSMDHCETLWEAKQFYRKWMDEKTGLGRDVIEMMGIELSWKGKKITSNIIHPEFFDVSKVQEYSHDDQNGKAVYREKTVINSWAQLTIFDQEDLDTDRRAKPKYTNAPKLPALDNILFVFADKKLRSPIRSIQRMFGEGTEWNRVVVISEYSNRDKEIIDLLGNPPEAQITYLSKHEEPPPEKRASATIARNVRTMYKVKNARNGNFCKKEVSRDMNFGGRYLVTYKNELLHPQATSPDHTSSTMDQIIGCYDSLGCLEDKNLYLFNSTHRKLADKNPKWVNFYPELKSDLLKLYSDKAVIRSFEFFYKLQQNISKRHGDFSVEDYFSIMEKSEKIVSENSYFKKPFQKIKLHLNILNLHMNKNYSVNEVLRMIEDFFFLNKISRNIWPDIPEVNRPDPEGYTPDLLSLSTYYPILSKIAYHIGYSNQPSRYDIIHYINLCDANPELVQKFNEEK